MVIAVAAGIAAVAHLWLVARASGYDRHLARAASRCAGVARRLAHRAGRGIRHVATSSLAKLTAIGFVVGGVWSVTFWRLVTQGDAVTVLGINDYPLHVETARDLSLWPLHLEIPEFLFHLVTKGYEVGVGERVGPVLAMVTFTALTYVTLVLLLREPPRQGKQLSLRVAAVVAATYFFLETPVLILLFTGVVSPTTPFVSIHWWGNPTFVASLPFTLLLLPLINRVVDASEDSAITWPTVRTRYGLAATAVLGSLAKPSFTVVLIPALPIYLLWVRRARWLTTVRVIRWAVFPAMAVVLWQIWFLGSGHSGEETFRSTWVFELFVEPIFGWKRMGPMFWFPLLLVALAAWASRGRFVRERAVQLTLVTLAIAVPLMLTVREGGDKSGVGNMAIPTQACVAVLLALALRSLAWESVTVIEARPRRAGDVPLWSWVAGFVGIALLVGGILAVLDGSAIIHIPANWELIYQGS